MKHGDKWSRLTCNFEIDCVFESQCAVAFLHADAAFLARGHLATFVRAWLKKKLGKIKRNGNKNGNKKKLEEINGGETEKKRYSQKTF